MRKSYIYLFVLGLVVLVMTAISSAGLVVSAQNSNSSMTMAPTDTAARKKPRRHKMMAGTGRCDPMKHEQTDLSGTYTGKIKHGAEPAVDGTLTITGNDFTATAGSTTHSGRITAVTTCGYTAVTMMMGNMTPPAPSANPPAANMAVSLRGKKMGDRLTLTSVPGEKNMMSFTSAGMAKAGTHKHRRRGTKPAPATAAPKM